MNTFGYALRLTTFGESHGECVGGVLDGIPPNLLIDIEGIKAQIARRGGGRNAFVTPRQESDICEIMSGVFEGKTTGAPLAFRIKNTHQRSQDYHRGIFRPSHADWTYFHKYGHYDYRGGGRSSARETLIRVIAASLVQPLLEGICVESGVWGVGGVVGRQMDFDFAQKSEIFSLDPQEEQKQKACILSAKQAGDSVGGEVIVRAKGQLLGLGEPMYYRLDGEIARAMMGIHGVKAVEIGEGVRASLMRGSEYNDAITKEGFLSNHSGGILGGIANGEEILVRLHFKPTPSISLPQRSIDQKGVEQEIQINGRHDPCIAVRGSVVAEAMMRLVLADMILMHRSKK